MNSSSSQTALSVPKIIIKPKKDILHDYVYRRVDWEIAFEAEVFRRDSSDDRESDSPNQFLLLVTYLRKR